MAGVRNFIGRINNIRSGNEGIKKPKATNYAFDKYRIYNTARWKSLRLKKLMTKPLCEVCEKALATEVDHIIPFSTGLTDKQKLRLGFDYSNLQSICYNCHLEKHNRKTKESISYEI